MNDDHRRPGHRPAGHRLRTALAALTTTALLLTLSSQPVLAAPEEAPAGFTPPVAKQVPSVPVTAVVPLAAPQTAAATTPAAPAVVWPTAGVADVDLGATTRSTSAATAQPGRLPVTVRAGTGIGTRAAAAAPKRVRVTVHDRATAVRAGIRGILLDVKRIDGAQSAGPVDVTVDYRAFRSAYGADWATRLRLVDLPSCALGRAGDPNCAGTALPSRNDVRAGTVTTQFTAAAGPTLLALEAAASGPAGDYAATSLAPSSTWSAGGNSGDFSWSYPMRVPPAIGGPAPAVGLSYSSQSVDGRHAATNNQPSWIGEGFEAWPGFIERRYRTCSDDMSGDHNNSKKTGDQCWATDNATVSLAGHSGELIYNAGEDLWHLRKDDGTRVKHLTGGTNDDNDGEHWVLTTVDGMQYWFGLNKLDGAGSQRTKSTWTMPVYGNHPGEPCHANEFTNSSCTQGYRWNLDYVVDLRGNTASYWYDTETNKYATNFDDDKLLGYVRAGSLQRIAYGTRKENGVDTVFSGHPAAQVLFGTDDRCLADCGTHTGAQWKDVPWDQQCTAAPCKQYAPTFWSTRRLSTVTTQVWNGSRYRNVDRWTLTHSYPDPGDGTRPGMWLDTISHDGLADGKTTSLPDVELKWVQKPNRVDTIDHSPAMNWMRLTRINTESGGSISVVYSDEDCVARTRMPSSPSSNTMRCYPVRWTPEGYTDPLTDYFHKYVVTTVYEIDNTGGAPPNGSPRVVHSYDYADPGWHYNDDDGLIAPGNKTWSDWRGYGKVTVTTGDPGEQTATTTRYFLGMHGDKLSSGTRTATLTGAGVPTVNDEDTYAGMVREAVTYNGPGGAEISRQVSEPWRSEPTASRTVNGDTVESRYVATQATYDRVLRDGGRGVRVNGVRRTFDRYGMVTDVDDAGDLAVTGDETCAQSTYEPRNTTRWLLNVVHRTRTFAATCARAQTPQTLTESQVISDEKTSYDGHGYGTAPDVGAATLHEKISAWNNGNPTFIQESRADYDSYGRVRHAWDAMDKMTETEYTPADDGPLTMTVVTNPLDHVTRTTLDPAWGSPTRTVDPNNKITDLAYDGLGRLTKVWLPGRDSATQTPNTSYGYLMRTNAVNAVTTSSLNAEGDYVTSYTLYDGLLRKRQTQAPSPSGGRLITETFYDTAGRKSKDYDRYYNSGAPGTTLVTATDRTYVPNQTRVEYDGAGRGVATIFQPYDRERWRTRTSYGGDHIDVTPPAGGTATATYHDVRNRVTMLKQFRGGTPAGEAGTTTYTYNGRGLMEQVTDPAGNQWSYGYDVRGQQTVVNDPDRGRTTHTYDKAGHLSTTTDSRGKILAYQYDAIGRKIGLFDTRIQATARARWTYDTIAKGKLSQSVRYAGAAAYISRITGYDNRYQPTGHDIVIPTAETGLNDTYHFDNTYAVDGSLASTSYPAKGGLDTETVTYHYDETLGLGNRMTTIYGTNEFSYVADTDYNALSQIDQLELYTGLYSKTGSRVFQSFNRELETGRLTGVRTDRETLSPYTVNDIQYRYDNAGNVLRTADVAAPGGADVQCFGYDHLRRLTQAHTPAGGDCATAPATATLGGPAKYWLSWQYDAVGNRTEETDRSTANATRTTSYTYPAPRSAQAHTLTGATTTVGNAAPTTAAYAHDEAGNMTSRPAPTGGAQTLAWDAEGHLASSTDSTGTTTYLYDADGNRLVARDPKGKTLYLPGQEIRFSATGGTRVATRYYTFNGQTIASRTTGGFTWLTADRDGTSQVAVDPTSQQAVIRRQTPFGGVRGQAATWPNTKGFVGGTADQTGLTHLGAREYDPTTGRFVSVDPIQDMRDPQQWNGYAYANNNPTTFSDPSGLLLICGDRAGECDDSPGRAPAGGGGTSGGDTGGGTGGGGTPGGGGGGRGPNGGVGREVSGNPHAHDTAIALRVLDLQVAYPGAWITANQKANGGADLVCWNCAARATHGAVQEVWVWEFKAVRQGDDKAGKGVKAGVAWAENHTLRPKNAVVKAGVKFPHESSSVVLGNPNEVVTVYSDSRPGPMYDGVERYEVKEYDEIFSLDHPGTRRAHEAHSAAIRENKKSEQHRLNLSEPGVVDDPVSGWAIAGGIGVVAALGGWGLTALVPAAGPVAAVVGAGELTRSQVGLAGGP